MRFFFLDGSALAKRYVAETGSPLLNQLFDHVAADRLAVLNVGFAEVVSILVRRKNAGTLSAATFSPALLQLGHEIIHATDLWRAARSARVARIASQVHTTVPTTRESPTKPVVSRAARLRRASLPKRYQADGDQASTGLSVSYRITSAAKSLAVS
jgi:hypothetical protein